MKNYHIWIIIIAFFLGLILVLILTIPPANAAEIDTKAYCPIEIPSQEPSIMPSEIPTATPEATVTPTDTSQPQSSSSSISVNYHPPTCNGVYADRPTLLNPNRLSSTSVSYDFQPVTADKYSVRYGYSQDSLVYGIPYLPNTSNSFAIDSLLPNTPVWAILTSYHGECAIDSLPLDP